MGIAQVRRTAQIDTLRGLACLMLVSFHVVGVPDAGLRLPDSHWLTRINDALLYLRMPLFTFISGYVYGIRPFRQDATQFMRGKMRRLLLPLLTVGTLFAVAQRLTPGTNATVTDWWLVHIVPVGHFWFLEALFIVFLIIVTLERLRLLVTPLRFGGVFFASLLLSMYVRLPHYFAVSGVVYLLPFFLAGLACRRFELGSMQARWSALLVLLGAGMWLALEPNDQWRGNSLAGMAVGMSSAFLLLRSGWRSGWLAYLGSYSFPIYLMHVFFTAASRIFFHSLGLSNPSMHLLLGTTAGMLGPIVAAHLIGYSARLELWLLGTRQASPKG